MSDRLDNPHIGYVLRIVLGTLIAWALAGIAVESFDPRWPETTRQWENFFVFAFIAEFLIIKTYRMIDNTIIWKRLGISLIVVNGAFALLYLTILAISLFPSISTHDWFLQAVRIIVAASVAWSAFEVLRFPGEATRSRPWLTVGYGVVATALVAVFLWRVGVIEWHWFEQTYRDFFGSGGCDITQIDDPDCTVTSTHVHE